MITKALDWVRASPLHIVMAGGGVALVFVMILAIVMMSGGEDEIDYSVALGEDTGVGAGVGAGAGVGLSETDVEERVMQTIAAQVLVDVPEPTADIPATLIAAELIAWQTREPVLVDGSPGFSSPSEPVAEFVPRYGFSVSDERFLAGMGLPVWYSTRIHLELESIFKLKPELFLNTDESRRVLEWMEYDVDRALRDISSLDSHRDALTPSVRSYGNYIEEMVLLNRESVSLLRTMYQMSNDREGFVYGDLTDKERSEIDTMYWDVKENVRDYSRGMQRYGCSVCGELYRGRDGEIN